MTLDLEPRDRTRFLAVAILLAVFMAGTFAGATMFFLFRSDGHRVMERREHVVAGPEGIHRGMGGPGEVLLMKEHGSLLGEELGLEPAQQERVDQLMEEQHDKARGLMEEMEPRMRALVDSTNAAIEEILTPEQRERHRELQEHRRELIVRRFSIPVPPEPQIRVPATPAEPGE